MKLFQIIFFLFNYINVISFKDLFILKNMNKKNILFLNNKQEIEKKVKKENPSLEKTHHLFKLTRPNNIIPTTFLCFTGGWIMNPSIYHLLHSTPFIISTINTILIMSASMVINDIYDLNIDKINSLDRPLVNGKITRKLYGCRW